MLDGLSSSHTRVTQDCPYLGSEHRPWSGQKQRAAFQDALRGAGGSPLPNQPQAGADLQASFTLLLPGAASTAPKFPVSGPQIQSIHMPELGKTNSASQGGKPPGAGQPASPILQGKRALSFKFLQTAKRGMYYSTFNPVCTPSLML